MSSELSFEERKKWETVAQILPASTAVVFVLVPIDDPP